MTLDLAGRVELRTARVGDHVETHAFVDGRPIPLTAPVLDALALLAAGRPLAPEQARRLVELGVLVDAAPPGEAPVTLAAPAGRIALRPTLTIECEQPPQPTADGLVHPQGSAPLSMYVRPDLLGGMQALVTLLRHAWQQLWRAAIARGRTVDPDEAAAILTAIARAEVERDRDLAAAFAIEEPFRLVPRGPLQQAAIAFPIAGLRLAGEREWRRRRRRAERFALVDGGVGGHLASAGRLLGALAAGLDAAELGRWLERAPELRPLHAALVAVDALGDAPARPALADAAPPGTIVHLGHACVLANLGGAHVLVDPWLPPGSALDPTPAPAVGDLPPLAAILITHHHWDHLHAETLLLLDKRVPVIVPAQDEAAPVWPRTAALLRHLGFTDVRALPHGASLEVGQGGRITAAPFTGEDPCALGWSGNTYVLEHAGRAALVHVDASPDRTGRSTVSTGAIRALRDRFGPLDPVLATRRQELGSMLDYGWEALLAPARAWVEPTENCATGAAFLAALCRDAGARALVLYSEGGGPWFPAWTNFIPVPGREAHAAPYQHLWEPLAAIEAAVADAGARTLVAAPYRRYRIGGGADADVSPPVR